MTLRSAFSGSSTNATVSSALRVVDNGSDLIGDVFQVLNGVLIQSSSIAHVEIAGTNPVLDAVLPFFR